MSLGLAKRHIRRAIMELQDEPQADDAVDSLDNAYEELTELESQFSKALRQRIVARQRRLSDRPFAGNWRLGFA